MCEAGEKETMSFALGVVCENLCVRDCVRVCGEDLFIGMKEDDFL